MGTGTTVTSSVSISIYRTSILRTSNCITGINENKCNIYNNFVKSSTFVSGVPIVRNCAHTHIFNSTGPNLFKLQAVDKGPKMSKTYDGDEKISTPSTLGRIRVNTNYQPINYLLYYWESTVSSLIKTPTNLEGALKSRPFDGG